MVSGAGVDTLENQKVRILIPQSITHKLSHFTFKDKTLNSKSNGEHPTQSVAVWVGNNALHFRVLSYENIQ